MKLTLLKEWDNAGTLFKPDDLKGQFLEIEDSEVAGDLISRGIAEEWKEPADPAGVTVGGGKEKAVTKKDLEDAADAALDKQVGDTGKKRLTIVKEPVERPKAGYKSAGHWMKDIKGYRVGRPSKQFLEYVKFTSGEMEEGYDPYGGFLTPEGFLPTVLRIDHAPSDIASRCRQVNVSGQLLKVPAFDETSRATGSRRGGTRGYHTAEGAQHTKSNPLLRQVKLEPTKVSVMSFASDEVEEDSVVDMGQLLLDLAREELLFILEDEVINGTGAGQMQGIVNANCLISVAIEAGQAADTIVAENVIKMHARMHRRSRANGVWLYNQNCEPQLYTMAIAVGTGGVPVFLPPAGLADAPYGRLLGRPAYPSEFIAGLGDANDIMFCDFSMYLLGMKGGIKTDMSDQLRWDYDQNAYKASVRMDGQPWWNSALTPYKGTGDTQGPFISLAERA